LEFTIYRGVAGAILAAARAAAPAECCGILLGRANQIMEAVPARNLSEDPNRFLIDPAGHIDARRRARQRGLEVVGFYHSHPHSPARPSATDLAEASYPDHVHLIVGLQSGSADIRLFKMSDQGFEEVALVTDRYREGPAEA
jgi:proteasome lid subunit RPN8/RPN11